MVLPLLFIFILPYVLALLAIAITSAAKAILEKKYQLFGLSKSPVDLIKKLPFSVLLNCVAKNRWKLVP
jgi:hypothetical protein